MTLKTFIDRPILSCVIAVLIVFIGIICLVGLPMEQYPDMAPPTVRVSTTYAGANAETVQNSVIVPLEESINGVDNMIYMTSTASNTGSASIQVYFEQGTDPDMATVNVKNRVSEAEGMLPAEVTQVGVTVKKMQNSMLKIISLYCPDGRYDQNFITNYFYINISPRLSRIEGVGNVNLMGDAYAMRIWLDPLKMAQYGLIPSDIDTVLSEQNIESATGTIGQNSDRPFQYTIKYRGRYETPEEFGELVIRSTADGEVLRLKDVAEIELGAQDYNYKSNIAGVPGTTCMISQTSGSNAIEIITEIDKVIDEIRADLPAGLVIEDLMSTSDFLNASMNEVIKTLLEAFLLVIIVVFVFLQSWRSTIIPSISIIVSLIGTFAFVSLFGFSLNLITLFALVLVIGTVVDDAIVVVEAVQAQFDYGERVPYQATVRAMDGISSAIITTSLVFMAVFIPTSFMGGTSGIYYRQFGLTMAVAVGISAISALTVCPALCALIMTPHADPSKGEDLSFSSRFHIAFEASFGRLINKYKNGVSYMFNHKWLVGAGVVVALAALLYFMQTTKTGLVPDEDTGTIFVNVNTAPGSSLQQTQKTMDEIAARLNEIPQIELYSSVTGFSMLGGGSSSEGMVIVKLKNWDERKGKENEINSVLADILARTSDIQSAKIFAFAQPTIVGYGSGSGFDFYIQDRAGGSIEDLKSYADEFLAALNARPEISMAYTSFDTKYPQYELEVDAARCMKYGVSVSDVLGVISGYTGGSYSSNFNRFSKIFRVMVQASPEYRYDLDSFNNMYVRTSSGEMTPVSQFITLSKVYGSETLNRFNLYNAISVNGIEADGYSSGDALNAIREVAEQTLPTGYGFEFSGMSREESETNNTTIIFVICIIFIYLILCALYESVFIPMAVMLSVPFGLMGSFLFVRIFGLENNIYTQVGLIMLIGLLAKTAILLTEFASARRKHGLGIREAALEAAGVRLRPILMTALTLVVGMLPLCFATGAGANGNVSLGVGVVGGMIVGTIALLFVVPALFIVFQTIEEKVMKRNRQ